MFSAGLSSLTICRMQKQVWSNLHDQTDSVEEILASYNDKAPLSEASHDSGVRGMSIVVSPSSEALTVFSNTWQVVGRVDQVAKPGDFVTADRRG